MKMKLNFIDEFEFDPVTAIVRSLDKQYQE